MSGPSLEVACAAVARANAREQYDPHDYKVCLHSENGDGCGLFRRHISSHQDPQAAALEVVREETGRIATTAHSLTVSEDGCGSGCGHTVTLLYAIPVPSTGSSSSSSIVYHSLASLLRDTSNRYLLIPQDRSLLQTLDQWLRDRHTLPFTDPSLLFLCSPDGEGVGGLVKAIIDNPVFSCHQRPPEDNLVIALNNPVFTSTSRLDLDATQA